MRSPTQGQDGQDSRGAQRFRPKLWAASAAAALLLILAVSGTLSSWTTAIVTNEDNKAGTSQAIVLTETGPGPVTCTSTDAPSNSFSCTTINKYGNAGVTVLDMQPGSTQTTTVTLQNTGGSSASTFTLTPGTCVSAYQPPAGAPPQGLCDALRLTVACTGSVVLNAGPVALSSFTAQTFTGGLAAGATESCDFTVALPDPSSADYADQTATQNLVWTASTP